MSIIRHDGTEADVPRADPAEYFRQLADTYCGDDPRRLRYLSQLCLREVCGWTFEQIGLAFGQNRGRVHRQIEAAERGLRWAATASRPCPPAGPHGAGETAVPPAEAVRKAA